MSDLLRVCGTQRKNLCHVPSSPAQHLAASAVTSNQPQISLGGQWNCVFLHSIPPFFRSRPCEAGAAIETQTLAVSRSLAGCRIAAGLRSWGRLWSEPLCLFGRLADAWASSLRVCRCGCLPRSGRCKLMPANCACKLSNCLRSSSIPEEFMKFFDIKWQAAASTCGSTTLVVRHTLFLALGLGRVRGAHCTRSSTVARMVRPVFNKVDT